MRRLTICLALWTLPASSVLATGQSGIALTVLYATADKPLGPWVKANENPVAATNLAIGVSGPGHNSITHSPDGKELFIVYHSHADPKNPSGERVVNIDRLHFDDVGRLRIKGPTRSPQPIPTGADDIQPNEDRNLSAEVK